MRQLRDQNISFLLKLSYEVMSDDEALWVCVIISKYGMNENIPYSITWDRSSFLWKSLSKV